MKMINIPALEKGATIVDIAFMSDGSRINLDLPELIGVTAAYISRGIDISQMEQHLGRLLGPTVGSDAKRVFDTFEDHDGRGLWTQGPALDDVIFTDGRLARFYSSTVGHNI